MSAKQTEPIGKKRFGAGCFIILLTVLLLAGYTVWQIREPGQRARRIHQAIQPGMSYAEVESLLTGRYYCFYERQEQTDWKQISREEFVQRISPINSPEPAGLRMRLTFMSTSPGRTSILIDLDSRGKVTKVNEPYSWD
jgi:hypothetical protein